MADDKKIVKWRTTRKGHKVGLNSTGVIVKGHPKVVGRNISDLKESTGEMLERMQKMGDPRDRIRAAHAMGMKVRDFAGEMAFSLVDKRGPYGKLAIDFPTVKRAGNKMVKAMEEFAKAILETEKYMEVREDLDEAAQPKLNKYDPGSLLGWVVHLLEKYELDEAASDVKRVSKSVSKAWQERAR